MAAESTSDEKIRVLYDMIMSLTLEEQRKLLTLLGGGEEGPDIGVREPRRPFPPSDSMAAVAEHDPDWGWIMPEEPYAR